LKILILTSCTGEKAVDHPKQLTLEDFQAGVAHVTKRENEIADYCRPAGEIYTGEQHLRLMRGVRTMRESGSGKSKNEVNLHILSAGYGVIPESRVVAPYETTFATMKTKELREWADALKVPEDFRKTVTGKYDLGLVLLGDNYLQACNLDAAVKFGGPTLLLCGTGMAKKLPTLKHVRVVPISNPEAKRFSCGLVGLKGELAARLLKGIGDDPAVLNRLMDPKFDLLAWLEKQPGAGKSAAETEVKPAKKATKKQVTKAKESKVGRATMVSNPAVDKVIQIPKSWWDKPHRNKLRYFIPEWDDLVDPNYDFLTDTHSGGTMNWLNEVYAHQMYPEPNYDGILLSRAVAEKGKAKTQRINNLGVHRMLRVPREFPIMGDCGAFDYIMEDVPPYSTEDVIDYYTRLDFDVGVSVDHLIVKATDHQRMDRYNMTIENAAEFLKQHRKARLPWTPVGAVQGWDPASYAAAAGKYAKMGYDYVGLGGLVRSTTKNILAIVEAVREQVPRDMRIHLFGIARPGAVPQMVKAGVTSIDSASHLRRAWLGTGQNYFTLDGKNYTAIRIPQAGKSFRAKRMVSEERVTLEKIERMESDCLNLVRDFDKGKASLTVTLDALCEYDNLVDEGRMNIRPLLEELLVDAPWKSCPCDICLKDKVEVVIFRGNNRNRRRGFHNTFVFYKLLEEAVNTGKLPASMKSGLDPAQLELFDPTSL
jgi:hypothetical protein